MRGIYPGAMKNFLENWSHRLESQDEIMLYLKSPFHLRSISNLIFEGTGQ